ncbi:piggyBac transposable element-derived protein 4-like isoform X2 [Vespula squamosa]|uniref:PiggyBac transposable element-derived protein 4-like isoform X2 n=1 Tax=Vespula squamosa TaxID=30214 RepID=A0ABD2BTZ3_VESSQ
MNNLSDILTEFWNSEEKEFICSVTTCELKKWFVLAILMGLIKKPRMNDYWSTNVSLETSIFCKTMTCNRFT